MIPGIVASQLSDAPPVDQEIPEHPWLVAWDGGLPVTHNDGSLANENVRARVNITFSNAGNGNVRVTFASSTSQPMVVTNASIAKFAGAGDAYDSVGPVVLTFDGGSAGFSIAANSSKVSDPVAFTFLTTDDLVVAMKHANTVSHHGGVVLTGSNVYRDLGSKGGADDTMATDTSGYTLINSNRAFGVNKIEVQQV